VSTERIAKYEAWIRELEERKARLGRTRGAWLRLFVAIAVASFAGFLFGPWIGAASAFTGVLMCLFGVYTVLVREGDYDRELAGARRDLARLRPVVEGADRGRRD
jgi:hypothetical protein